MSVLPIRLFKMIRDSITHQVTRDRHGSHANRRRYAHPWLEALEDRVSPAWMSIGPAPQDSGAAAVSGRVSALAIANSGPGAGTPTLFLGAAGGGVWKSTDFAGTTPTWQAVSDNIPLQGDLATGLGSGAIDVGAIAVDPNNAQNHTNYVYVGTGEANYSIDSRYGTGILRSTNGGQTFTLLATGSDTNRTAFFKHAISQIIVDPNNSQILFASVVPAAINVTGDLSDTDTSNGIYRSPNGGRDWIKVTNAIGPNITVTDMDYTWRSAAETFVLYAGVRNKRSETTESDIGGIYTSPDLGATWNRQALPGDGANNPAPLFPATFQRVAFAADHVNGHRVVYAAVAHGVLREAGTELHGVYQTTDGGAHWVNVSPNTTVPDIAGQGDSTQGYYDLTMALSPDDSRLYIGGQLKVAQYSPQQRTWVDVSNPPGNGLGLAPHPDYHAMAFDSAGNLDVGNDGGIYRLRGTPGGGQTWDNLNSQGLSTIQFFGIAMNPGDPNYIVGGSQDNGVAVTDNAQNAPPTWTTYGGGDGGHVAFGAVVGGNAIFATGNFEVRFKRASGPWRQVILNGAHDPLWPLYPVFAQNAGTIAFGPQVRTVMASRTNIWESLNPGAQNTATAVAYRRLATGLNPNQPATALAYGPPRLAGGNATVYVGFANGSLWRMDETGQNGKPGPFQPLPQVPYAPLPWGNRPISAIASRSGPGGNVLFVTIWLIRKNLQHNTGSTVPAIGSGSWTFLGAWLSSGLSVLPSSLLCEP